MGIMSSVGDLISGNYKIIHSKTTNIFTQYGIFSAKMYKHKNQEYLVIMSKNFPKSKAPIFYIHSDEHECNALDQFCDCVYPIGVALNMIKKDGGFILYSSFDPSNIDKLLKEVNTSNLDSSMEMFKGSNLKAALKGYKGEYLTIDFILKDLKLKKLQLISDNPNIYFIIDNLNIEITKQIPTLSFEYGDKSI